MLRGSLVFNILCTIQLPFQTFTFREVLPKHRFHHIIMCRPNLSKNLTGLNSCLKMFENLFCESFLSDLFLEYRWACCLIESCGYVLLFKLNIFIFETPINFSSWWAHSKCFITEIFRIRLISCWNVPWHLSKGEISLIVFFSLLSLIYVQWMLTYDHGITLSFCRLGFKYFFTVMLLNCCEDPRSSSSFCMSKSFS